MDTPEGRRALLMSDWRNKDRYPVFVFVRHFRDVRRNTCRGQRKRLIRRRLLIGRWHHIQWVDVTRAGRSWHRTFAWIRWLLLGGRWFLLLKVRTLIDWVFGSGMLSIRRHGDRIFGQRIHYCWGCLCTHFARKWCNQMLELDWDWENILGEQYTMLHILHWLCTRTNPIVLFMMPLWLSQFVYRKWRHTRTVIFQIHLPNVVEEKCQTIRISSWYRDTSETVLCQVCLEYDWGMGWLACLPVSCEESNTAYQSNLCFDITHVHDFIPDANLNFVDSFVSWKANRWMTSVTGRVPRMSESRRFSESTGNA